MRQVDSRMHYTSGVSGGSTELQPYILCQATTVTLVAVNPEPGGQTPIPLTTEVKDTHAMFAATDSKIYITEAGNGIFEIVATILFATDATGMRELNIMYNGEESGADSDQANGTISHAKTAQKIFYGVEVGDYFEVAARSSFNPINVRRASLTVRGLQ